MAYVHLAREGMLHGSCYVICFSLSDFRSSGSSESTHILFSVFESVWGLGRKFLAIIKKVLGNKIQRKR